MTIGTIFCRFFWNNLGHNGLRPIFSKHCRTYYRLARKLKQIIAQYDINRKQDINKYDTNQYPDETVDTFYC